MAKKTMTENELTRGKRIHNPVSKRLYTLKEAAEYLGRSVWGIRELIWSKKMPIVKQQGCRKMYVDRNDLDAFIEKNKIIHN